jgi:hypothetical protein
LREASVEGFEPLSSRGNTQHSLQDENIRKENDEGIKPQGKDDDNEAVEAVDTGAGTG